MILRSNNFLARVVTFGMTPLFWEICLAIGQWIGCNYNALSITGGWYLDWSYIEQRSLLPLGVSREKS